MTTQGENEHATPTGARSVTTSGDACYITHLPAELIYSIIDFIPPEFHFNFACTCKSIASYSSSVLKRHQEAFRNYRVASDISPTTIPSLLRSAFGRADPLLAWHVRSIEIWYDRAGWVDWKPLNFDQVLHQEDMDVDCTSWEWQNDEPSSYLDGIEDQLYAMVEDGDDDILTEAREQLEQGFDGILKMLLIINCPRLRDVRFITHEHREKSTLGWLKRVIQGSILYGSHWPPGLCSIHDIAVGVESDTWMTTRHTRDNEGVMDAEDRSMEVLSTLLRLPRLHSIYYNRLMRSSWDDETDYSSPTLMPARTSSVKHIFLDDSGDTQYNFRSALTVAPRALETFTLRAGNSGDRIEDADVIVQALCSQQSRSLHTLMLYGPYDHRRIHGYRCSAYRNEELENGHELKTVAIDISDVELDCMYAMSIETEPGDDKLSEQEERSYFASWFRKKAFPKNIERLIFWGKPEECFLTKSKGLFLDWLEDALVSVIESRRDRASADDQASGEASNGHECFYPNLKAIYLEDIERRYIRAKRAKGEPRPTKLFFQTLVKAGRDAGIDVHTLTNRAPPQHSHDFPVALDKFDLRSGPWWQRRSEVEGWVFDVYKGRRVPPGCGRCGGCELCLEDYSEELWGSLDG